MDWAEIRTRVGQEIGKRSDLLRHRMGRSPDAIRLINSPANHGRFFFAANEITERVDLLRKHLPTDAGEILLEADAICAHRFRLLGYENLDYGPEIDWHLDRVHGKRAPLDPWFTIPFLEFAAVGDHKVTWELNRHQHLVTLAKAWLLSKDEKYLHELVAQWRTWIRANPYPLGINWGSTLEVAFRSLSWIWMDQLLADAPGHSDFRKELLPALAFHGRYIERYLSTYFSPNTHLLGEAVALFFIGSLYPQIQAASRWQETGWKIVLHEAHRQVRPDGVYFEQSLHYHVYALDFFLYARILAAQNGQDIPAAFDEVLGKMLDVVQALSQAGPPEGFGDDDGGRVFNPRRNRTEHMTDPLALGALAYGRSDLLAARLTEESIWLFGERAVTGLSREPGNADPHSAAFADGGVFILADSQPFAQQAVVDAGPQGVGRSGHGHADALSLRLTIDGQRWLVDSGSGVYISSEPADRNTFRGTAAHNTMRVDDVDQAIPSDPFSWTAIPTTRTENWTSGKTFSYFAGSHDGYARLTDPVTHRRSVLSINGGPSLVRDMALGQQEHELELLWHFAPNLEVREDGPGILVSPTSVRADSRECPTLSLFMHEGTPLKTDITRGLLSPAYGKFEPAPVVRFHNRVQLPAEIATVLTVHSASAVHDSRASLVGMRHATVQVYELIDRDQNQGFCFALDKRPWSFGPWSSDAEVLYCRIVGEHLVHLVVIGGTSVAWQGRPLLKAPGSSAYFEWRKQDSVMNAEPAPFAVSPLFGELTGTTAFSSDARNTSSSTFAEKH
jgi:hypothetical protein